MAQRLASAKLPVLHSPNGVARLAGVDVSCVRNAVLRGDMPGVMAVDTGNRLVFTDQFVAAFLRRYPGR